MRSITLGRVGGVTRILLNGHFVFQTGALDQGYWPDGLYTPPTDDAIRFDILTAKQLGYNLLREHQKIQPARWYYWADKLGILVWQDMPQMHPPGNPAPTPAAEAEFRRELRAIVVQLRSDPSIVTWIPFNEGWSQFDPSGVTQEVKSLDRSALVDSDSGSADCCNAIEPGNSDLNDTHLYSGPFSVSADNRASVIGEYGAVLAYPPPAHRWPGVLTSLGAPVAIWGQAPVTSFLRAQYEELTQEMRVAGLSGSVFTEFAGYEDELGILTYDRRAFTMPPALVRGLNDSLIAASEQSGSSLRAERPAIPSGTTGLWSFREGSGTEAGDSSGYGHTLSLTGGAGWTTSPFGGALAITAPGQSAVAEGPLINTGHAFTISVWLNYAQAGESGTAVSEPGPDGSSFSLGLDTAGQGGQSFGGLPGTSSLPNATWWTFVVPGGSTCTAAQCGVRANMRYDDGRFDPRPGRWHQVTAVYDTSTATIGIYTDGVPDDVEHVFGIPPARGPLTVGAGVDDYTPTDTFLGAIAESADLLSRAESGRGVGAVSGRATGGREGSPRLASIGLVASGPPRTLPPVVCFEFCELVYELTDNQATLLAERLRNYAKGTFPAAVKRVADLSGNSNWTDGALAVADFTEELLVGNLAGPLPLEGKSAEATYWALRLMQGLGRSAARTDAAALRDALAERFTKQAPVERAA